MKHTGKFSLTQCSFWMCFCLTVCFAALFLQKNGYSNTEIGLILALGNTFGSLLAVSLSARVDKAVRLTAGGSAFWLILIHGLCALGLLLLPGRSLAAGALYVLLITSLLGINSMNLKLCVDLNRNGVAVFGTARGLGSAAFVALSTALGLMHFEAATLLWLTLAIDIFQIVSNRVVVRALPAADRSEATAAAGRPMPQFIRENPRFFVLLFGVMLLFFAHNVVCNFTPNVAQNVGGDDSTMSYLNAFMALMEIPVMFLFPLLRGKRGLRGFLLFAFVCFAFKALAIALAGTIPTLFAAFVMQAPSFALYTAASVDYAAEVIPFEDSAKSQSLVFSMTTIGSVLAGLIGGWMYDNHTVRATLMMAVAVSVVGAVIACLGVEKPKARS